MRILNDVLAIGFVGLVFVAGPVGVASAAPQAATAKIEDSTLKSRVVTSIKKNATLATRELDVDVHEGVVTLKGIVRTTGEKARAARLATIKGVTEVHNELVVDASAVKSRTGKAIDATQRAGEKAVDATKDAAQKTGEKTKEIAATTGNKTKEIASEAGEAITDSWITTKVKTKFFDETLLKDSDINVETNDHVVTLKGTVASKAAKARAESIVRGTVGVTQVINNLVVKP